MGGGPQNNNQSNTKNTDLLNNKTMAWINSNYGKPQIIKTAINNNNNNNVASSPILHSTQCVHHHSPSGQQPVLSYLNNAKIINMNLSGDSNKDNTNEPGNNPSKSKIFEHKKALRNVSPEMESKLTELNNMGYKNRTFNLVLLKQENGDMSKVIDNLKQFYQNN